MYLIDTNVFLEVLLTQENRENCKKILDDNIGNLHISDFSLHSIGVILFRNKKEDVSQKFVSDIFPNVEIVTYRNGHTTAWLRSRENLDWILTMHINTRSPKSMI